MAVENFTTWTEVDPEADLTVTSTTVTIASLTATHTNPTYVSLDKGAGFYSGAFTFRVGPINISSASSENSRLVPIGTGLNLPREAEALVDSVNAVWYNTITNPTLTLAEFATIVDINTPTTTDSYQGAAVAIGTNFYLELSRSGTTATLKIYSDAYTTLVDTLTITLSESHSYRYVYVASKGQHGSGATVGGTIQNADLAPGGGGGGASPVIGRRIYVLP
jgi:hypothetical protein